ncbi:MAG: DUF2914 domain-containing protein [Proteobacteria bacterium]|nr:DUF2914 domain-containing protein [Pseudomonadota bacterium]
MKKISISVCMFLCLFVLSTHQGFTEDIASDTPGVTMDNPDVAHSNDVSAESAISKTSPDQPLESVPEETMDVQEESEGEITYSAIPETETNAQVSDVSVVEARICEGINDREPMAPGDVFSSEINSLFCFSRIQSPEQTEIKHIWYCNGNPVAEIPLSIGVSSGWRTFSSKTITPLDKGNWKVDIVTASGTPIRTIQFIIN